LEQAAIALHRHHSRAGCGVGRNKHDRSVIWISKRHVIHPAAASLDSMRALPHKTARMRDHEIALIARDLPVRKSIADDLWLRNHTAW
jgi:hypothetical protein